MEFGFGAGTAFFNVILQTLLAKYGLRLSFLFVGLFMWSTLIPLTLFYRYPTNQSDPIMPVTGNEHQYGVRNYNPLEMLRTLQWYIIYFSFAFTITIVLMFGAHMKMIAEEFNIPQPYINALMVMFPLGNGFS